MKRSEINALIENALTLLHAHQIRLPPFAYWTPADWEKWSKDMRASALELADLAKAK